MPAVKRKSGIKRSHFPDGTRFYIFGPNQEIFYYCGSKAVESGRKCNLSLVLGGKLFLFRILPQEQRETGYISYPEAHRQETPRMSPQRIMSVDSILVQFLSVWPQEGKEIGLPHRVELGIYKRNCAQFQPVRET
jgi:hypothetical protein